eukprot:2609894-Prymnesium_polylepis.2
MALSDADAVCLSARSSRCSSAAWRVSSRLDACASASAASELAAQRTEASGTTASPQRHPSRSTLVVQLHPRRVCDGAPRTCSSVATCPASAASDSPPTRRSAASRAALPSC